MADFEFIQNPLSKKWMILAPRRAKRPNVAKGIEPVCPFCPGREKDEQEVFRIPVPVIAIPSETREKQSQTDGIATSSLDKLGTSRNDKKSSGWSVRVLNNKYPFAPIHEIIIHSPDHHKNFGELPLNQVELIFQTYRQRYLAHQNKGQVYIFHNRGEGGGESLPHPHTQLTVVPSEVKMDLPRLDPGASSATSPQPFILDGRVRHSGPSAVSSGQSNCLSRIDSGVVPMSGTPQNDEEVSTERRITVKTLHFYLFCPKSSQWPDEVWVAPNKRGRSFGEITDEEISDLARIISRLVQIMTLRHGNEFPFNFYIYPGGDWYLRLIPRTKSLGGFEIGTGIFVNTQTPQETIEFLKTHFENPDEEKIKKEHQAEYSKHA